MQPCQHYLSQVLIACRCIRVFQLGDRILERTPDTLQIAGPPLERAQADTCVRCSERLAESGGFRPGASQESFCFVTIL